MKVQKDNDRRKGLVKCIGIIYICIIFYLTSIINNIRRFHYFLVALFRSVGVELVIPGLVEDIIGVVFIQCLDLYNYPSASEDRRAYKVQ